MKIAMVCARGAERVEALSQALRGRGHDVTVFPQTPPDASSLDSVGPFARLLEQRWQTGGPPDVCHAHDWSSGVAAQLAAKRYGVATVQTFRDFAMVGNRNGDDRGAAQSRIKLETLVVRGAGWVLANSTDAVTDLVRLKLSRSRISVVPHGVDVDGFTPVGPVAERGGRPFRVVSAGLWHNGFDTVLTALRTVQNTELVIIGHDDDTTRAHRGGESSRVHAEAEKRGIADRVRVVAPVNRSELAALLRSADVVASMPGHDDDAMVLEAMACAVPVVGSEAGTVADAVVDEVTGLLVKPRDPAGAARAVNTLLSDSFRRRAMGSAGRDRAQSRYTWSRAATDTERIYELLVSGAVGASTGGGAPGLDSSELL